MTRRLAQTYYLKKALKQKKKKRKEKRDNFQSDHILEQAGLCQFSVVGITEKLMK